MVAAVELWQLAESKQPKVEDPESLLMPDRRLAVDGMAVSLIYLAAHQ